MSIAKAGIVTSLNARTTILAAANPLYGRYNTKISVHENINLPAALMSRFDHIFLLLDKPDQDMDADLAKHVAFVHQMSSHPALDFEPYNHEFLRGYIQACQNLEPLIPDDLHNYIVNHYVEKRKQQTQMEVGSMYITPRTLLGVIRTAQAIAKLRFADLVDQDDIDEAMRLIDAC